MKKSQEHKPVSEKDRWWKICMIMKLTLFMCVFLVVTTLGNGFSQQRITMQLGNTTIKKALTEFQRQTDKIVTLVHLKKLLLILKMLRWNRFWQKS